MNAPPHVHAVITGGSSGIGLAIAHEFARKGAGLTLIARNRERLERARSALTAAHAVPVAIYACDVCDFDALKDILATVGQQHSIDFLVSNAGTMEVGRVDDNGLDQHRRPFAVNYEGALHTYLAGIKVMRAQGHGQIGFVSSVAGFLGAYGYGGYAPSKFAVTGLAECVRMEAADWGVGITIVFPPDTDTPLLDWERAHTLPECRAISKNARLLAPEVVARKLVRGMEKNRFEVYCNGESRFIRVVKTVWPRLYYQMLDRIVRKDRERRARHA